LLFQSLFVPKLNVGFTSVSGSLDAMPPPLASYAMHSPGLPLQSLGKHTPPLPAGTRHGALAAHATPVHVPVSQRVPVQPPGQAHVNFATPSVHMPRRQGCEAHSSTSLSQRSPS
jgi:hypothetical protein